MTTASRRTVYCREWEHLVVGRVDESVFSKLESRIELWIVILPFILPRVPLSLPLARSFQATRVCLPGLRFHSLRPWPQKPNSIQAQLHWIRSNNFLLFVHTFFFALHPTIHGEFSPHVLEVSAGLQPESTEFTSAVKWSHGVAARDMCCMCC